MVIEGDTRSLDSSSYISMAACFRCSTPGGWPAPILSDEACFL